MAKTVTKTSGYSGLQTAANKVWKRLSAAELESYLKKAEESNKDNLGAKKETRKKRIKKLTDLIRDSVSLLFEKFS